MGWFESIILGIWLLVALQSILLIVVCLTGKIPWWLPLYRFGSVLYESPRRWLG